MLHFPPEMDGILQFLIDAEYNEEKTKMKKTGKKVFVIEIFFVCLCPFT